MSSLKVNYVHQSFGDYTKGITGGLKSLVETHVTCIVSGYETPGLTDSASDVLRCHRFRHPKSAWSANQAVQSLGECDVLHWQAAGNPWVDAAALRIAGRQPFVVTVHDMVPHPGDQNVLPGTFRMIQRLVKKADQVIVHAESVKRQVVDVGKDPANVHIVPHGELGSVYPRDVRSLDRESNDTILFFGRMQRYKGLDVVAEAMAEVTEHRPDATLLVAGRGPALDELLRRSGEPRWLSTRRGFVPSSEIRPLFTRSTVVVLPYLEASQSGVAALAIGMGRAVVASSVGGLVEMVDPEVNGLLVPSGDPSALAKALIRVLDDRVLRARLERGAVERSQTDLSWSHIAKRTVEIYELAQSLWSSGAPSGPKPERKFRA